MLLFISKELFSDNKFNAFEFKWDVQCDNETIEHLINIGFLVYVGY